MGTKASLDLQRVNRYIDLAPATQHKSHILCDTEDCLFGIVQWQKHKTSSFMIGQILACYITSELFFFKQCMSKSEVKM